MLLTRSLLRSTFTVMKPPSTAWRHYYSHVHEHWVLLYPPLRLHVYCSHWCKDEASVVIKVEALNRIYAHD